jgi:hypothetical protein
VIIDQTDIFKPFFALLKDFILFKIEMTADNSFKAFGRILNVFKHSKFDVTVSNNIGISLIFFLSFFSSLLIFEARLIEINLFTHNDGLNRQ